MAIKAYVEVLKEMLPKADEIELVYYNHSSLANLFLNYDLSIRTVLGAEFSKDLKKWPSER